MKPDFIDRAAKIIEEVRTRTCVDKIDTEALFEILQEELIKYRNELLTYGHSIGYNEGYDDGYAAGYKRGVNDTIGEVQNQSWKKIKMNRTKLTDKRLIEVVKEVLGTHYFKSDEDFLKQALENYYYEALNRKEFAREFVANGYWGGVTETYWFTYWYVRNIIQSWK